MLEMEVLNKTVNIPMLLVKLGADENNIKQMYNKADFRCNCWWRNGDNPHGLGITYNPNKGKWQCTDFTQREFGNIDLPDFVMKLTGLTFYHALEFIGTCCDGNNSNLSLEDLMKTNNAKTEAETIDSCILDCFEYGLHPYLQNRGYTPEVAKYFNLGFCNWGELIDRCIIPIMNEQGKLVSVQGRSIDDETPKYKFLDGTGDSAKLVLYNYHKAIEIARKKGWLLVVEGCPSVWRLHQYGLGNAVATMSTSVTDKQIKTLVESGLHICIWFDWDENNAGQYGTIKTIRKMEKMGFTNVSFVWMERESCPDDMKKEEIAKALKTKIRFPFKGGN